MKNISIEELNKVVGGEIVIGSELATFTSVCIDSRKVTENALFVALVGKRTNGHNYVVQTLKNGASVALVSDSNIDKIETIDKSCKVIIKVSNTLVAMQALAKHYRNKFLIPTVAITGSVGKTTTKEMCYSVLSGKFNTYKNFGNLNSDIGMPLAVFGLKKEHNVAIFEMGMSNKGEIETMSDIANPYIAIITNIGISHIENLKTKENILKAKLEIETGLTPDGIMLLNGDDKMLAPLKGKLAHQVLLYGIKNENCDFFATKIKRKDTYTTFSLQTPYGSFDFKLNSIGSHNVSNAVVALATGICLGISKKELAFGLESYGTDNLRQKIFKADDMIIIDDSYNAAPDSMIAALDILKTTNSNRKIAVLSDMLELGDKTESSHIKIGKLASSFCDFLLCYGDNSRLYLASGNENILHFSSLEECAEFLLTLAKSGDAILFKGSHSMKTFECMELFLKGRNIQK
ncbi:MAG: UDP-N-acetylmuramoyl-tripeptide--D-alanyl-D-alanine ligase [Clostridia bacterium]